MNASHKLTVGIVCHNEIDRLESCLNSIFLKENLSLIEKIIIVDNHSTDGSLELLKTWQNEHPRILKLIERKQNQLGLARQMIVDQTTTPWLLFTDADCVVPKDWVGKHFKNLEEANLLLEPVAGVCGPNRLPDDRIWQVALNHFMSTPFGHGRSPQAMRPAESVHVGHLPTTNALFKMSALKKTTGFRSDLMIGEDAEMGAQLLKLGFKMKMYPEPTVINHSADHFRDWTKRMFRFGAAQWNHSPKRARIAFGCFALGTVLWFSLLSFKTMGQIFIFIFLTLACSTLILKNKKNLKFIMAVLVAALGTITLISYVAGFLSHPLNGFVKKVRMRDRDPHRYRNASASPPK